MRDLEIRGAGNLLGESQSGHIAAVGYDLYCQMVTEAVSEMKGEPVRDKPSGDQARRADRCLPARPTTSPKEELRLEAYRRLAAVTTPAEVDDIRDEWEDRYGPLPEPAARCSGGPLRAECHRLGIRDIQITGIASTGGTAGRTARAEASETMRLRRISKGAKYKEDLGQLVVPLPRGVDASTFLAGFLGDLVPPEEGR